MNGPKGRSIPLSTTYRQGIVAKKAEAERARGKEYKLEDLVEELKRKVGFKTSTSSLSRWFQGATVTIELTDALCRLFGAPSPLLLADDPDEVRWFEAGQRLRGLSHENFETLLRHVEHFVRASEADKEIDRFKGFVSERSKAE